MTTKARAATGISEDPTGSGSYVVVGNAPTIIGQYAVMFDSGVISLSSILSDALIVTSSSPEALGDMLARVKERAPSDLSDG